MQWRIFVGLGTVVLGLSGCSGIGTKEPATMVLTGGKVMTMDGSRTAAQSVAVRGNQIIGVGSDQDMVRYIGPNTQVIKLNGKTLLPGFIDAHVHPVLGSERLGKCSVDGVAMPVAEIVAYTVSHCLTKEDNPAPGKWIEVMNLNPANFTATAADLDKISTSRPVILSGSDGHTSWVNSVALQLAHITAATPDPAGGQIARDGKGQPTGFLKDSAQDLATNLIPPLSTAELVPLTQAVLDMLRSKGITSVQDAWAAPEQLDVYETMEKSNQLKMRVRATLRSKVADDEAEYQRLEAIRAHFAGHPLVRADAVKIFSDGVIEYPTQTAAMIHPYLDDKGHPTKNKGGRYFEQDVLNRYVARLDKDGFTIHVHSIGDFTTHAALDAFQYARDKNGVTDNRHQIAHLQIVDPADFPRFAKLNVIANMQLFWAQPNEYSIDAVKPYILPESYRYMYPAGSLKAAGATIAGGSDWPVDVLPGDLMPNTPLSSTQVAMTRRAPNVDSKDPYFGKVLNAAERVDMDTMLAAYTINGAKALKQDATTGSIEVGKLADLVVLDSDLSATAPDKFTSVKVRYTILNGAVVYQAVPDTVQH